MVCRRAPTTRPPIWTFPRCRHLSALSPIVRNLRRLQPETIGRVLVRRHPDDVLDHVPSRPKGEDRSGWLERPVADHEEGSMGNQSVLAGRSPAPTVGARRASSRRVPYPHLHPGPGLSHEQVASHQRARIYAAMIELVAERGYGAVTVLELARLAGVSKHTVYEHFPGGKQECFLCTYELIVRRSSRRVGAAQKDCRDWRGRAPPAVCAWGGGGGGR